MGKIYRLDLKGSPFKYETRILEKNEYSKIVSEINTNYNLYKNQRFAVHHSVGIDGNYYLYYFENHGFNDYNIVEKIQF